MPTLDLTPAEHAFLTDFLQQGIESYGCRTAEIIKERNRAKNPGNIEHLNAVLRRRYDKAEAGWAILKKLRNAPA